MHEGSEYSCVEGPVVAALAARNQLPSLCSLRSAVCCAAPRRVKLAELLQLLHQLALCSSYKIMGLQPLCNFVFFKYKTRIVTFFTDMITDTPALVWSKNHFVPQHVLFIYKIMSLFSVQRITKVRVSTLNRFYNGFRFERNILWNRFVNEGCHALSDWTVLTFHSCDIFQFQ